MYSYQTCNNIEPQEEGGGEGLKGEITACVSDPKVLKLLYRTQVLWKIS